MAEENEPELTIVRDPDRLAALHDSGLLDTEREPGFDRLTRVAARALDVPIVLVSLVDADRQFFKSCFGLSNDLARSRETPLSHSFCRHVVQRDEEFVVPNAREHPDLRDNPLIDEEGVVAYAGIPLRTPSGHVLGTLCAMDTAPREWSEQDLDILRDIAGGIMTEIELRTARDDAEHAALAKSDFMAMVSHELRTPLNAVIGYAELMDMGIPERLPPGALENLHELLTSASYLQDLVEQLLTFSRLDAGAESVELDWVDVNDLVEQVRSVALPLALGGGLDFSIRNEDPPDRIETDPRKIRQLLVNLLGNAVKFTEAGQVRLIVEGEEGSIRFRVEDDGIGISPEDLDRVFEPFWQGQRPETRSFGGTGLGLAIAHRFSLLLGGDLRVESTPEEGSAFTLTLPVRHPDDLELA